MGSLELKQVDDMLFILIIVSQKLGDKVEVNQKELVVCFLLKGHILLRDWVVDAYEDWVYQQAALLLRNGYRVAAEFFFIVIVLLIQKLLNLVHVDVAQIIKLQVLHLKVILFLLLAQLCGGVASTIVFAWFVCWDV